MENLEEILSKITSEQEQIKATYDAEEKQWEERKKEFKRQIKAKKLEGIKHKLKYLESLDIDNFEYIDYSYYKDDFESVEAYEAWAKNIKEVRIDFLNADEAWILAEFLLENAEPQMGRIQFASQYGRYDVPSTGEFDAIIMLGDKYIGFSVEGDDCFPHDDDMHGESVTFYVSNVLSIQDLGSSEFWGNKFKKSQIINDIHFFEECDKEYDEKSRTDITFKSKGSTDLKPLDIDRLFASQKRIPFEKYVTSPDILEIDNIEWFEKNLGPTVTRMFGFDQKNSHHCYDLMEHTLRAAEAIKRDDLTEEEFTKLRIAAFFHDIGKPDVASFNEKTGQQVFYGHAAHSVEVAKPILEELGYSEDEIAEISFYIGHHDDFISYKTNMQPWMKNHEYIREITPDTVSEVIIRNKYDFEAMGYDEHQTKYICYTLGHDGKEPNFMFNGEPVKIDVNMDEVREKIESGKYNTSFIPTAKNYDMLLRLCRADALAQSEIAMQNGKQVGTRKEKVENIENIQSACEEAFHSVSEKVGEYSNEFIEKILLLAARKVDSRKQSEKAQALLKEFEKLSRNRENDSIGE